MKRFFQFDCYIQFFIIAGTTFFALISLIIKPGYAALFYPIVGLAQLLSYLIRLCIPYKKSRDFKIYGWFILPVWLILLYAIIGCGVLDINIQGLHAIIMIIYLICALVFSPLLAILYIKDCNRSYKGYFNTNDTLSGTV